MAQSLKKRLDGNRQEVLDYVGRYGIHEAMNKYGVKDYLAMRRFVIDETGDENYGINPKFSKLYPSERQSILQRFVQEFADHVVRMETENKEKDRRIELLEAELEYYQRNEIATIEPELISVMQACEA